MTKPGVNLRDPSVRAELDTTPEGRKALEHLAVAEAAAATGRKDLARHRRRAAERIAKKVLRSS